MISEKAFPIFDSGFNLMAIMDFNGEAVTIRFEHDTKYAAGDRLCLAISQLRALIGEAKTDEQSAQNN